MTIGYLHILYTDGKRETINNVTRVSNLSKKSRYFYYETLYNAHGKGTCIWFILMQNFSLRFVINSINIFLSPSNKASQDQKCLQCLLLVLCLQQ